jgi:hypothetical protein
MGMSTRSSVDSSWRRRGLVWLRLRLRGAHLVGVPHGGGRLLAELYHQLDVRSRPPQPAVTDAFSERQCIAIGGLHDRDETLDIFAPCSPAQLSEHLGGYAAMLPLVDYRYRDLGRRGILLQPDVARHSQRTSRPLVKKRRWRDRSLIPLNTSTRRGLS